MTINSFSNNLDDKLEESLVQLAAGIALDEVVTSAGEDGQWLQPLLEIATEVSKLQAGYSRSTA